MSLKDCIPIVPNWPKPGVNFLDITGILENPRAFAETTNWLTAQIKKHNATSVVAVESRGFPLAAVSAKALGLPLVLARKKDKLPGEVFTKTYNTEYSQDSISIKQSSSVGNRPYVVDDILATGGTALAAVELLKDNWAIDKLAVGVVISLEFLPGRSNLNTKQIHIDTLLTYE